MDLPLCRHHVAGDCPQSQLVLLDEKPTHRSWGCLTCGGITLITRTDFNAYCRERGDEERGLALRRATERERRWFTIHRR